jgi:hypothetical protein
MGFHRFTKQIAAGDAYLRCARCGKEKFPSDSSIIPPSLS